MSKNGRKGRKSVTGAKLCETCSEGYLTASRCDRRLSVVCVTCQEVLQSVPMFSVCFLFISLLVFCQFAVVFLLHNLVVHCCLCFLCRYQGVFCAFSAVFRLFSDVFCLMSAVVWCLIMVSHALLCDSNLDLYSLWERVREKTLVLTTFLGQLALVS